MQIRSHVTISELRSELRAGVAKALAGAIAKAGAFDISYVLLRSKLCYGHQSVRNVPLGGGEAPKGVLRCFQWVKMFQSMDICSQQVTGCTQGDPRCSQGAGMCVKGVLRVLTGVLNNIYGALEVLNKVPKMLEAPNVIPTSHKVFPR